MTPEEIQKILDGYGESNTNELSDEAIEQRYWARQSKDKDKTRKHYQELGRMCVESGRIVEVSRKGGQTVTDVKLEKLYELNKAKRELTDEQVLEMKEIYVNNISIGLSELAEKYGVSKATIKYALDGTNYSDVGEPVVIRQPLFKCPHCDAPHMTKSNFTRFHGDKCKNK